MKEKKSNLITRRQALVSIAAISAGALIRPSSAFCSPVNDKLRFAVVGDWGTGDRNAVGTAAQMYGAHQRSPFDFVISAGDNIYPNGAGRYFTKNFEQPFATLLKDRISFYTVLGNHDVSAGRQDQCQYPLFNMGGQNYYKVEKGNGLAEFFMLDSTDFDSAQAAWLESSLRASKAKWKVAVFHHPIYSSGKTHGSAMGLRRQLEPILARYDVKVALTGHDHIYERTKLQQGIQHFVTGAGGKVRRGDVDLGSSFREASFDQDNHFMLIEMDSKQINFQAISETGAVVDSGAIK
jgi:Calcineurin-like phosphoesterase